MSMPDISDFQLPNAPTANLLGFTHRNSTQPFAIEIDTALLKQSTAIAVLIVFNGGTSVTQVAWTIQDVTLSAGISLEATFTSFNPGMQVRPFPGDYVYENAGHNVSVEFSPLGGGTLIADVYVYGLATPPVFVPQVGLNGFTDIQNIAPVTVAAATTTTVVAAPPTGMFNRIVTVWANHVTAAAAVARCGFQGGIGSGTGLLLEFFDLAVANFQIDRQVVWDTTVALSYVNGSSQPHLVGVGFMQGSL